MKVIDVTRPGGPEVLTIAEAPVPAPAEGEVLVRVAAAGVNRPDIQQRRGLYPPPPGASPRLGLDIAGTVAAVGEGVAWPRLDDPVCGLTPGGSYAEYCVLPALQCLPVPRGFDMVEAASLPEVFFTAWNNVMWLGRLAQGETLLVQGGTSGVGMAAIQIARQLCGARVLATAGTAEKCAVCRDLGAATAVSYRGDWAAALRTAVGSHAIDVVLDGQAGHYTEQELGLLAPDGRVVLIASHMGERGEVSFREIVRRRLTLTGSTLRPRPPEYKGRLAAELRERVWPLLETGGIRTVIYATFPLEQVAAAHSVLDAGEQIGKVVLTVG